MIRLVLNEAFGPVIMSGDHLARWKRELFSAQTGITYRLSWIVRREIIPFDEETILRELSALPDSDRAKLEALIEHYEVVGLGNPSPAKIDDYGDGLYRLRHIKPAYQGRLIFFTVDRVAGFERLVILMVYKKQSQKVPTNVLDTAKRRKRQWEESRGRK